MQKLVLMSIIIMTLVIPVRASRSRTLGQGLRATVKWTAAYCLVYLILLLYVYPRLEGK